jgi:hypothetical protein
MLLVSQYWCESTEPWTSFYCGAPGYKPIAPQLFTRHAEFEKKYLATVSKSNEKDSRHTNFEDRKGQKKYYEEDCITFSIPHFDFWAPAGHEIDRTSIWAGPWCQAVIEDSRGGPKCVEDDQRFEHVKALKEF